MFGKRKINFTPSSAFSKRHNTSNQKLENIFGDCGVNGLQLMQSLRECVCTGSADPLGTLNGMQFSWARGFGSC